MAGTRALLGVLVLAIGASGAPATARAAGAAVRIWTIHYRSHDGVTTPAYVALPARFGPAHPGTLPLVISPHGRGVDGRRNLDFWGSLPAAGNFAVVSPDGRGRVLALHSWGYAGQIDDLASMPAIVHRALPWLSVARRRVYAAGASMGGQEILLLVARFPHLLAAAAALDPVSDFALQYRNFPRIPCDATCLRTFGEPLGTRLRRLARIEIGGTPATAPAAYASRSPRTYARRIASSGVPLQLWWSRRDQVVVDQALQSGRFFARLKRLDPAAPITEFVGAWQHGRDMNQGSGLPTVLLRFHLLPAGYPIPRFAFSRRG
ncbi:MAG: alpha/beta hydrolase family protein [Gaiellaceae bacterium]